MIPIAKPSIGEDEIRGVIEVLKSGYIAQGRKVEEFEKNFAEYIGVKHAIAVSNGTSALDLALKACKIREGDEVITTPFSFIATANAVLFQGAKPIFADIDLDTYTINPDSIVEKITPKTKAIIGVHLYGHPFDVKSILEICEEYNLILIEDCAQAHGAEFKSKKTGCFGIGCFSFYATKNITTGEGGMITTNDDEIAKTCRLLRNHGEDNKYNHVILGYNLRMTDIQASIGLIQLKKLDKLNEKRRENARYFNKHIKIDWIKKPIEMSYAKHVYHQYVILVEKSKRDKMIRYLKSNGISCAVHYPKPIYLQPLYKNLNYEKGLCPNAEYVAERVISIPVHPMLSKNELNYIVNTINGVEL